MVCKNDISLLPGRYGMPQRCGDGKRKNGVCVACEDKSVAQIPQKCGILLRIGSGMVLDLCS
jgi:hypothetical protein